MEVIVSSILSLRGIDPAFESELRKRYTFTPLIPRGTPHYVKPVSISLCHTYKGFFNIPRDIALLEELGSSSAKIIDLQERPTNKTCVQFNGTLDPRRNQIEAVDKCLAILRKTPYGGGCLLSLPPGFGKTACALYISAHLPAKRTLILVHTTALATQWQSRVNTFLRNATVVLIKAQDTVNLDELKHATHIIMLLQTVLALKKRGSPLIDNLKHDLIFVDECHHLAARTLCKVVETVGSRYRLGLSATLQRKDGLDPMLSVLLGSLGYACERQTCPGLVVQVKTYKTSQFQSATTFVQHITEICHDERRINMIVDTIRHVYKQGRYIIVLSDRLNLLDAIEKQLEEPIYKAIGGNNQDPDMATRPVILATYAYASEGLDIPVLNTCILATPRLEVKQSIGRILRSPEGKPLVIDIVDEDRSVLKRQFSQRKRFYTKPLAEGGLNATLRVDV
jgi:superfamily II DNA or RNA helicase